jgi:hypothetical protein
MRAEFSGKRGLCSCNRRKLAHFAARSLQQKIPFLTLLPETGSIPAWGAGSLVQIISTTQSSRIAENVLDRKLALFAGILGACFQLSRSLLTLTFSRVDF